MLLYESLLNLFKWNVICQESKVLVDCFVIYVIVCVATSRLLIHI